MNERALESGNCDDGDALVYTENTWKCSFHLNYAAFDDGNETAIWKWIRFLVLTLSMPSHPKLAGCPLLLLLWLLSQHPNYSSHVVNRHMRCGIQRFRVKHIIPRLEVWFHFTTVRHTIIVQLQVLRISHQHRANVCTPNKWKHAFASKLEMSLFGLLFYSP